MILKNITLVQFKNYEKESFSFHPDFNIVVGQNGMGKTNLLDAIYYMSFCRSNFSRNDRNVMSNETDFFRLVGSYEQNGEVKNLVYKVPAKGTKVVEFDAAVYSKLSEHIGKIPLLLIAPGDIQKLLETSEERRKLIDMCIAQFDISFLSALVRYNRLLKQRNAYLKSLDYYSPINEELLASFDIQMEPLAEQIYEARKKFVEELNPVFESIYKHLSNGNEQVKCNYKSVLEYEKFTALMKENRALDKEKGRTTKGIHRDDIEMSMNSRLLRLQASQGQLKSYVLALKLAQYELLRKMSQKNPILLLDDIFDKLDGDRVFQLVSYLVQNNYGQCFISDTHQTRVSDILMKLDRSFNRFVIKNGKIHS